MSTQRPEHPETDFNEPVPWLIVVDPVDYKTAEQIGKALGSIGVTGTFRAGTEADMLQEYSAWKRAQAAQKLAEKPPRNAAENDENSREKSREKSRKNAGKSIERR